MERIGLSPGAEIGGYTILAPLGSGGMGTVYRAVDGGGTPVALKLLHPHIGADPASRERLRREVHALQRMRHPGVAAVLDAEADSTEAFLVTELVPGQDLAERVRARGRLDATGLHALAEGLRDALAAVHAAGVVHRDLKPSNVLIGAAGPVLIDFGIAQSVDETRVTSTGFVVGTPGYLAPELVDGAEPTPATDWWGWAALLTFAATGRAPFGTRPLEAVLARTRAGEADLDGLGPVTAGALWDALAPDPEDRPEPEQVVAALAEAVRLGETYQEPAAGTAATTVLRGAGTALGAGAATAAGATVAGATVALDGGSGAASTASDATTPVGAVPLGATAATGAAPTGATAVLRPGPDATLAMPTDVQPTTVQPTAPPVGGTAALPPSWSADGTAVLPTDGQTRAFEPTPPSVEPGGRTVTPWPVPGPWDAGPTADGTDGAPWDGPVGEPGDPGDPGPGLPDPVHRRGSLSALALLAVASAALRPGATLLVLVPLLLVARTVGSVAESLGRRRERVGAKRSDGLRAVASAPWHLVKSLATLLPSLLVATSLVVMVLGVGWWLVGSGALAGGPWQAGADGPAPRAASLLVAGATVIALLALWWGPGAGTTRTGARWTLAGIAPGRGGALVVVLISLVGAGVLAFLLLSGQVIDWSPFSAPQLPTGA
ncbi:MAG TPA: serine/threonine-protein kinase [Cellulomonas sp.]